MGHKKLEELYIGWGTGSEWAAYYEKSGGK